MKVVILAGGRGSRLSELTYKIPKPMVEIGGKPMLYHIMSIYAKYGHTEFIIAGGYKADYIQDWLDRSYLPWKIRMVDTGEDTKTGGRLLHLEEYLNEPFMLTYGDGVGSVDINKLLEFHRSQKTLCTLTAVYPPARFGHLVLDNNYVSRFEEKTVRDWVNGGFFVCEPEALHFISGDEMWETGALVRLVERRLLTAYRHDGFWQMMDTARDLEVLEEIYKERGSLA